MGKIRCYSVSIEWRKKEEEMKKKKKKTRTTTHILECYFREETFADLTTTGDIIKKIRL
jgi:hypothetical protein